MKTLSIIFVNYKTADLLIDCLHSIFQFKKTWELDIIVVDNDSKDGGKERVLTLFPFVRWFETGYNAGFARANNLGIKHANGEIVLLLNTDTIVHEDAVQRSATRLSELEAAAVGVQLLNPDGSPQISGNYFMTGSLNNLLPLPFLGPLLRWMAFQFKVKKTNIPEAVSEVEVDWINGAFLMVTRKAIEQVGPLDEDFFLYAEEAEWCSRLRKAGKLIVLGELNVTHLQGASAIATVGLDAKGYQQITGKKGGQMILSNLVRIRKQYGLLWYFFHVLILFGEIPILFIGGILESILKFNRFRQRFGFACQYAKTIALLTPFLLKLFANKPTFYKVM
ncbi:MULTISPECIES: glycosyltransferase family 2 protein [unclassified Paraflavitalea]|uniref:glycosyltransferase family 2 protein n=1 Tax=unclassified Paraflavitalea TaxID=2798305 RepID=UPI003D357818